jgi:glycosyltransferase involved in cell wall biosynthesis
VSILEALACGVPVVASDVGSVRETVVDGETGRLFPAGDQAAFVDATVALLQSPAERRRLGAEGRRRVVARWSLDAMVRGYEQLIEQIYAKKMAPVAQGDPWPTPPATSAVDGYFARRNAKGTM